MTQVTPLAEAAELELDPSSFASESGITYHTREEDQAHSGQK